MEELSEEEAKETFDALLDRVEQGGEITITRDGRAIARFIPCPPRQQTDAGSSAASNRDR